MHTVATALIVAGLAVGVGALVVLHLLSTGLSPIRTAVSQYGISRHRLGYRIQTLAYAVAGLGAAIGVATLPGPGGLLIVLLAAFAVARGLISWSPMDEPGTPLTASGRRHGILAIVAFGSAGLATWRLAALLDRDGLHPAIATASGVLGLVMAALLIGMGADRRSQGGHFGLIERGFYASMTVWLALVAVVVAPR